MAKKKVAKGKVVRKSSGSVVHKSSSKKSKRSGKDTITFRKPSFFGNGWFLVSLLLAVVLVVNLGSGGSVISSERAGQRVVDFASAQGASAEVVSVSDDGVLYQVTISIQGQQVPVYVTKDGKRLIPTVIDLDQVPSAPVVNDAGGHVVDSGFSDEDNVAIQAFSECLAGKGFVVYAADWCPHCENLKSYFGGNANVEAFWRSCQTADRGPTQYSDECAAEGITGFPTMKLNGEELQVARTFEAIGAAVGCEPPVLS